MSVQAQIARLERAKEEIAAAISSKGVAVPSGTTLDAMAELIEKITVDTGLSQIIATVEPGSIVTATNGATTKTATSSGTVVFKDLDFGTWQLTATLGKNRTGKTVENRLFQIYYVDMPYTADFPLDYPYDYSK